eukprot:11979158-Prorocentrum_lima.AAC.1
MLVTANLSEELRRGRGCTQGIQFCLQRGAVTAVHLPQGNLLAELPHRTLRCLQWINPRELVEVAKEQKCCKP